MCAVADIWLPEAYRRGCPNRSEIAQDGERHLFFAVSLPCGRLEIGLPTLVPNLARAVRVLALTRPLIPLPPTAISQFLALAHTRRFSC
jgi:hypothetical protein